MSTHSQTESRITSSSVGEGEGEVGEVIGGDDQG